MRDKTHRICCRVLFLSIGLIPAVALAITAVYRVTPSHHSRVCRAWESSLESRWGVAFQIARVETTWESIVLHDVQAFDPDSDLRLLRVRTLEVAQNSTHDLLLASQPEVDPGQFLRAWELFHERVLRGPELSRPARISIGELTLQGSNAQTFTELESELSSSPDGIQARFEFRIAGVEMTEPAHLEVIRNRSIQPPQTGWHLQTGPIPLPCSVFGHYLPTLGLFGDTCLFQGSLWSDRPREHWNGELSGVFSRIDLESLTMPLPQRMTGFGELTVKRASFRKGRAEELAGTLKAARGSMSSTLLRACAERLPFDADLAALDSDRTHVSYRDLEVSFEMVEGKLGLTTPPGRPVAYTALGDPLLVSNAEQVPAIAFVQTVAASRQLQVPATPAGQILVKSLPLPEKQGTLQHAERPTVRVRLKR